MSKYEYAYYDCQNCRKRGKQIANAHTIPDGWRFVLDENGVGGNRLLCVKCQKEIRK